MSQKNALYMSNDHISHLKRHYNLIEHSMSWNEINLAPWSVISPLEEFFLGSVIEMEIAEFDFDEFHPYPG